jgi:lysophospholipase L1-like esterase
MVTGAEADDPFCLGFGESATLLAGHPWKRFAVLGDSVALGTGDKVDGYSTLPWCDRIAAELRAQQPDLSYLNLGARDVRAGEVLATQLEPALTFDPDLALVVCGGNDALRSSYIADEVDGVLGRIIEALQLGGAEVITVGIFDISHAPTFPEKARATVGQRMQLFSAHTAALAERLGTIHVNCTNHPAQSDPAMYSSDGLHGNMRCHQVCAALAVRRLGAHLGRSVAVGQS